MARLFAKASSHRITTADTSVQMLFGTLACLCRTVNDATAIARIFQLNAAAGDQYGMRVSATNQLGLSTNGNVTAPTITLPSTDGWIFLAISKPTGTATVRFHKYVYNTGVWTHENSAGTLADSTNTPNTDCTLGGSDSGQYFDGDIAVAGAFNRDMVDQEIESLAFSLMAWYAMDPAALWVLDQADIAMEVNDLSGHGANQTAIVGTTVSTSSVPGFSYGAAVLTPNDEPLARALAGDQPTATGALSRLLTALRSLAGDQPSAAGVLTTAWAYFRALAGDQPTATGALSRIVQAFRSLAGDQAAAAGDATVTGTTRVPPPAIGITVQTSGQRTTTEPRTQTSGRS